MPTDPKPTTTLPTTTGYYPGRTYSGYPGAYPGLGVSYSGYPGAWNGASAWNGLRRSQLGYGYPGAWNGAYNPAWNGVGAWNPAVNNAL